MKKLILIALIGLSMTGCASWRTVKTTTTTTKATNVELSPATQTALMRQAGYDDTTVAAVARGEKKSPLGPIFGDVVTTVIEAVGPAPNNYDKYIEGKTAEIEALAANTGGVTLYDPATGKKMATVDHPINLSGWTGITREPNGWEIASNGLYRALPWLFGMFTVSEVGETMRAAAGSGGTYNVGGNMTQSNARVESSGAGAVSTGGADQSYRPITEITETTEGSHNTPFTE